MAWNISGPRAALKLHEWENQAVVRPDAKTHDMECAVREENGDVTLWSGRGTPVNVPATESDTVAALLLHGRFAPEHYLALFNAATSTTDPDTRVALVGLFREFVRLAPPSVVSSTAVLAEPEVAVPTHHHAEQLFSSVQHRPVPQSPAYLMTVDLQGNVTSMTGRAAESFLRAIQSKEDIVPLRAVFANPEHAESAETSHRLARETQEVQEFLSEHDGRFWRTQVFPANYEGRVIGTVSYTRLMEDTNKQTTQTAMFHMGRNGALLHHNETAREMFWSHLSDPFPRFDMATMMNIIEKHFVAPNQFMLKLLARLREGRECEDLLPLHNGGMIHRYGHPVKDRFGQVTGMTFYLTPV